MMKRQLRLRTTYFFALLFLWLAGCSSLQAETQVTPVVPVEVTEDLVLTFDGESCQYDGPELILEGEIVIGLNNLTEDGLFFEVQKLDEGKTWQDMLDYFGEPGSKAPGGPPTWALIIDIQPVVTNFAAMKITLVPATYGVICVQRIGYSFFVYPEFLFEVR